MMEDYYDGLYGNFNPEKVWFTADTHFFSAKVLKYSKRPFESVQEMNAHLIRAWNETVPPDGIVFHLGDFSCGSANTWCGIRRKLNGIIYLIVGNHELEKIKAEYLKNFVHVSQQMVIMVGGQRIVLNHYPLLCYVGSNRKTWQLFGHVHSGPNSTKGYDLPRLVHLMPRQYDVGVDNNDFRPVSFAEVKAKIEAQCLAAKGDNK